MTNTRRLCGAERNRGALARALEMVKAFIARNLKTGSRGA
jgi:hypothetical protein